MKSRRRFVLLAAWIAALASLNSAWGSDRATLIDDGAGVLEKVGSGSKRENAAVPEPTSAQRRVRIAIVDVKKIFANFYKARDAEAKIDEKRSALGKELEERWKVFRKHAVPEEIRMRQQAADLQTSGREIREFEVTQEKQLKELEARIRASIMEEIAKVVSQVAEAEHADLVLDASASGSGGFPVLVSVIGLPDLSSAVIRVLNVGRQDRSPKRVSETVTAPTATAVQ